MVDTVELPLERLGLLAGQYKLEFQASENTDLIGLLWHGTYKFNKIDD